MNLQQNQLEKVISSASLLEKNSYAIICNQEFKLQFVGQQLCDSIGLPESKILGKSLAQIETPLSHLSHKYREISEKVLNDSSNQAREYLTLIPSAQDISVFHTQVNPLLLDQHKIGLYLKTSKVNAIGILPLLKRLKELSSGKAKMITINQTSESIQLTEREEFILFMIALGKYDKEISYFLELTGGIKLTRDAITKIVVRNLYQKFGVVTRSELIIQAHTKGFLDNLPSLLTPENCLKIAKFL